MDNETPDGVAPGEGVTENQEVTPGPSLGDVLTILTKISEQLGDLILSTPTGKWLKPEQVSRMTGISVGRLTQLRSDRKFIDFHKPSGAYGNATLYDADEVDKWIESSRVIVRENPHLTIVPTKTATRKKKTA